MASKCPITVWFFTWSKPRETERGTPLPAMYGKNLVFKTGGVDASRGPELVSLLAQGKLRTDFLITFYDI